MANESKQIIHLYGRQEWRFNGELHRLDGPAVIAANGYQEWYNQGVWHRTDGPARIWPDGVQQWWVNDKLHRLAGPAVIHTDGHQEWYILGQAITDEVKKWMEQQGVVWPWDPAAQAQFILTFA